MRIPFLFELIQNERRAIRENYFPFVALHDIFASQNNFVRQLFQIQLCEDGADHFVLDFSVFDTMNVFAIVAHLNNIYVVVYSCKLKEFRRIG